MDIAVTKWYEYIWVHSDIVIYIYSDVLHNDIRYNNVICQCTIYYYLTLLYGDIVADWYITW